MENNIRFDFIKSRKIWMAIYALIIVAGIVVFALFGANLSIDFKGGATFEYSFTGDIDLKEAEKVVEEALKKKVNITESTGYTTNAKTLVVSLVTDESVGVEAQEKLETKLNETFKDNKIELSSSNSVSPSIASNFFLKCLVAVVLASLLVILYVGIRFRKIGGVSAGMFALLALLAAYSPRLTFRLQCPAPRFPSLPAVRGFYRKYRQDLGLTRPKKYRAGQ